MKIYNPIIMNGRIKWKYIIQIFISLQNSSQILTENFDRKKSVTIFWPKFRPNFENFDRLWTWSEMQENFDRISFILTENRSK